MLKLSLSKAEYDALNAALKVEYKADGENFVLDVVGGIEDPGELRRAKQREVEARKLADTENTTLKTKLTDLQGKHDQLLAAKGDIATLESSWQSKLDAAKHEHETKFTTEITKRDRFIESTLVDSVANAMAAELSGENSIVLLPHIKARLKAELTGDTPLTRVLDKDGKVSALSVEDLKKEFAGDKRYAPIIIASKASGGGAAGGGKGNNGGAGNPGNKKFKELNDQERTDWYKRDPAGFQQAAEADRRAI